MGSRSTTKTDKIKWTGRIQAVQPRIRLMLVSNNLGEFERVEALRLVNWARAKWRKKLDVFLHFNER